MLTSRKLAGSAVLVAVALGCAVGQLELGRPRQLLRPPYVEQVPGGLLAAFVLLAVVGVAAAVLLFSRLVPGPHGWGFPALAVIASLGAIASMWGGIYSTAIDNAIPVFDWAFYAAPAALAGLLAGRATADPIVLGLLAVVPVAALNSLGWAVSSGVGAALMMAVFSGGFGLAVGLGAGMLLAILTKRPALSDFPSVSRP